MQLTSYIDEMVYPVQLLVSISLFILNSLKRTLDVSKKQICLKTRLRNEKSTRYFPVLIMNAIGKSTTDILLYLAHQRGRKYLLRYM